MKKTYEKRKIITKVDDDDSKDKFIRNKEH